MKSLVIFFVLILIFSTCLLPQKVGNAYRLHINNINLPFNTRGTIADVAIPPEGSLGKFNGIGFLFSSGFMVSGYTNSQLWACAQATASRIENFIPGEVYNVGSKEEWEHDIKYVSDLILQYLGKNDSHVTYKEAEPFTTRVKHMDFSKIRRDLNHDPQTPLEEGIPKTVEWMKKLYR